MSASLPNSSTNSRSLKTVPLMAILISPLLNRIAELKRLFIKIYEDNASGRLSDDRFDMLSLTYEREQKQLENECVTLWQETEVQERQNENIEKFIQTAHKYVGIDELDGYALRELVSNNGYSFFFDSSSFSRTSFVRYDGPTIFTICE